MQLAGNGDGGPGALTSAVRRVAAAYPDAVHFPAVGVLPDRVPTADVLAAAAVTGMIRRL